MTKVPELFKSLMIAAKITSMTRAILAPSQTQTTLAGDLKLLRMTSLEHLGMQYVNKAKVDFVQFLKDLRSGQEVICPKCKEGHFLPAGRPESTHCFYCSVCGERVIID